MVNRIGSFFIKNTHGESVSYKHKRLPAYSFIEIMMAFGICAGIFAVCYGAFFSDKKKEFDLKYNKVASTIASNISKDILENTGFRFEDYAEDPTGFQEAVLKNMDYKDCSYNNCWGAGTNFSIGGNNYSNFNNAGNWRFYLLKDKTVVAISMNSTDVLIDVNGKKGPNKAGKDIRLFHY